MKNNISCDKESIIVIDNITSQKDYQNNKQIKSELVKHIIADCIDSAYSLAKCGNSLHLKDKESVGNLIESGQEKGLEVIINPIFKELPQVL